MSRTEIRSKVTQLLSEILDDEELRLDDATRAADVEGWDSVNHIKLVIAIESEFGIRLGTDEVTAPEDVGALVDLIAQKIGSSAG